MVIMETIFESFPMGFQWRKLKHGYYFFTLLGVGNKNTV